MRGLSLPGCGLGVTVPTSIKPNPKAAIPLTQAAFLSKPAARPTRLVKRQPNNSTGSCTGAGNRHLAKPVFPAAPSRPKVKSWATSGFIEKSNGLICLYIVLALLIVKRIGLFMR